MTAIPDGGDAVVSALRDCGVTTVFGIPASYTIEVYDALARQGGIRSITARNEQAAAFMADGYARRSGEPGGGDRHGRPRPRKRRNRTADRLRRLLAGGGHRQRPRSGPAGGPSGGAAP